MMFFLVSIVIVNCRSPAIVIVFGRYVDNLACLSYIPAFSPRKFHATLRSVNIKRGELWFLLLLEIHGIPSQSSGMTHHIVKGEGNKFRGLMNRLDLACHVI